MLGAPPFNRSNMLRELLLTALLLVAAVGASNAADLPLTPTQPYSAECSNPVTYDAHLQLIVTAPYKTKQLRVWLPIPQSDHGQEVLASELSTFPESVKPTISTEPLFGNRFAYFEFAEPQGAMIISHKLKIKVWELNWQLDPAAVKQVAQWPESFRPYLRGESQAVVVDDRFDRLIQEIVPERRNPLLDLHSVMKFADRSFKYDHAVASLKGSSVHALEQRRGHCSDYHGFCAAMGRAMAQPTRITYGINTFPKASPSHCKLEAFIAPYGWVSFDVSETQKLTTAIRSNSKLSEDEQDKLAAAANQRLIRGFRDNTWFVQTRGSDYELVPKASARVPVVRTIYAEADGQPLPDPDPSSKSETKFAWMTSQRFDADRQAPYPFADWKTLKSSDK